MLLHYEAHCSTSAQFNEIAISDNEGGWLAFFCPWKPELGSAARRSIRSLRLELRPAWNSGRHAYEEASCGCATCTSTWTVAALAQRRASASQRRRRACYASTFLDSKSQFSFLVSQRPGSEGDSSFLCADYRMKREFTRTIPDSYFSLRAPASVHWAL